MADFELASRLNVMYDTPRGTLTVSDLWKLPLQSDSGWPNLDDIAKGLNSKILARSESFVGIKKASDERDTVALDVVKRVIEWRLEQNKNATEAAQKAETKRQLLEALAKKRTEGIMSLSEEELIKRINEL